MLLARGFGLPKHGEPWHLVQLTEPSETGTINEVPIMAFEVLFLTPERRETGTYIFTDESNELVGAMYCTTFILRSIRKLLCNMVMLPLQQMSKKWYLAT